MFRPILRSDPGVHARPGADSQVSHSQVCHYAGVQVNMALFNFLSLISEREKVMKEGKASGCLSIVRVRKELGVTWVLE